MDFFQAYSDHLRTMKWFNENIVFANKYVQETQLCKQQRNKLAEFEKQLLKLGFIGVEVEGDRRRFSWPDENCFVDVNIHVDALDAKGEQVGIAIMVIYVKDQRRGLGSKLLGLLCNAADNLGESLFLKPAPIDDDGWGGLEAISSEKLRKWYQQFGFVETEQGRMERRPKLRE